MEKQKHIYLRYILRSLSIESHWPEEEVIEAMHVALDDRKSHTQLSVHRQKNIQTAELDILKTENDHQAAALAGTNSQHLTSILQLNDLRFNLQRSENKLYQVEDGAQRA